MEYKWKSFFLGEEMACLVEIFLQLYFRKTVLSVGCVLVILGMTILHNKPKNNTNLFMSLFDCGFGKLQWSWLGDSVALNVHAWQLSCLLAGSKGGV